MLEVTAVLIHRAYGLRCSGSRRGFRLALHRVGTGTEFGDDEVQVFVCCGVELALGDYLGDVAEAGAAEAGAPMAKVVSRAAVSRVRWMFMGFSSMLNNNDLRIVSMLDEQRPDAVLP